MTRGEDLLRLVLAVHAITRMAAIETKNDAPSAQWRTLRLLREHGPQRVGDLAAMSRVTQPGMTRLVGQLADAGLVRRRSDELDARASVVEATPAGEEALDTWLVELQGVLESQFTSLDAADWDAVRSVADVLEAATLVRGAAR